MTALSGERREMLRHSQVLGVGAYRPTRVVPNAEVCERIQTSDEWIVRHSGIRTRRQASTDEDLATMAEAAATAALADCGLTAEQVDVVLVATMSHRKIAPSIAAEVGFRLKAAAPATLDISAACAGFCYGVALGNDIVRAGTAEHVLVIGVERMSDIVDPTDRSTAFLFGDGAGAVVIGRSEDRGIGPVVWGSDGAQRDAIRQSRLWPAAGSVPDGPAPALRMQGREVFRWAISEVAEVAREAVKAAGLVPEDLDVFVPHQANQRIVDKLATAIGLREDAVVARDVADMANTSAASIPLALDRIRAEGRAGFGDLVLLVGFGSGLTYAAQVIRMP